MKLGLRGQLILALCLVFAVSFSLLSAATLQLTRRNTQLEQQRLTQQWGQFLAGAYGDRPEAELIAALQKLHDQRVLAAARLDTGNQVQGIGPLPTTAGAYVPVRRGGLTLWLARSHAATAAPMQRLLLFYVGLTGLSVLLLAYVLLTTMLIHPLEAATRAAETMAAGHLDARVPLRGAAEVVRLARSYNHMADELRRQQSELQARVSELEQTAAALKASQAQVVHGEKLASVGRLSAGIAHEIGNPLSAMLGLLELLQDDDLPVEQQREFVARIQKETERIHHIIGGLLTYARKDQPDAPQQQQCDLQAVVADVLSLLAQRSKAQHIDIDVTMADDARQVVGGAAQLLQVILNLTQNAVQALADGGRIWIRSQRLADKVVLTMEDDGPGIAQSVLGQVFEPFATTKPPGEGTGLGLAVCHALVEQMGGRIEAENRAQGGARFVVTLRSA